MSYRLNIGLKYWLNISQYRFALMRGTTPKYILTKFWDAKIDIFDIIENNVILCVFEMSALGTTLMTVSFTTK